MKIEINPFKEKLQLELLGLLGKFILFFQTLHGLLIDPKKRFTIQMMLLVIAFLSVGQTFIKNLSVNPLFIVLNPLYAQDQISYFDTPEAYQNELRWINQKLRMLRLRFNAQIPLNNEEIRQITQDGELSLLAGQGKEIAIRLLQNTQRIDLDRQVAYPALLNVSGQALYSQNLNALGRAQFIKALSLQSQTTAFRYGQSLNQYLIALHDQKIPKIEKEQIKTAWGQFQKMSAQHKAKSNFELQYHYAKFLYFQDDFQEAKALFKNLYALIPENLKDQNVLCQAEYFLGIIALKENDDVKNKEALFHFRRLYEILSIFEKKTDLLIQKDQEWLDLSEQKPSEEIEKSKTLSISKQSEKILGTETLKQVLKIVDSPEFEASIKANADEMPIVLQIKAVLAQTLGRLLILNDRSDLAWQFFRQIPANVDHYQQSILEMIYLLRVQKKYHMTLALIDQLISQKSISLSQYQLYLWKAEALLKMKNIEKNEILATRIYVELDEILSAEIQTIQNQNQLISSNVFAWIPKETADGFKKVFTDLRLEEIQAQRTKENLKILTGYAQVKDYPAIQLALEIIQNLKIQLSNFDQNLSQASAQWPSHQTQPQVQALYEAKAILEQRIIHVQDELLNLKKHYDQNLLNMITVLNQENEQHLSKIEKMKQALTQTAIALKTEALAQINLAKGRLILSPTEIYFIEKETVTEMIDQLIKERRFDLHPIESQSQENLANLRINHLEELIPLVEKYLEGKQDYEIDLKAIQTQISEPVLNLDQINQTSIWEMLKLPEYKGGTDFDQPTPSQSNQPSQKSNQPSQSNQPKPSQDASVDLEL